MNIHLQANGTLTTTTPAGVSTTRPVPPSWASVAPLLARWQMALVPQRDGSWEVLSGFAGAHQPQHGYHGATFAQLPQAIAAVAARCEKNAECTMDNGE